jgi:hypothetical protein
MYVNLEPAPSAANKNLARILRTMFFDKRTRSALKAAPEGRYTFAYDFKKTGRDSVESCCLDILLCWVGRRRSHQQDEK